MWLKGAILAAMTFFSGPALAQVARTDSGLVQGVASGGITIFKGVPFAAPPTGELRWRPPHPAVAWRGVR